MSPAPLRVWSLTMFHTVSFIVASVFALHVNGSLRSMLGRLSTAAGLGSFVAFWFTTWVATRAGLHQMHRDGADSGTGTTIMWTIVAGGWNGVLVFAAAFVALVAFQLLQRGPVFVPAIPSITAVAIIVGVIAFATGAVIGFVYGVVDATLFSIASGLVRWAQPRRSEF